MTLQGSGFSVNTDHVKAPIFPVLLIIFPIFPRFSYHISRFPEFDLVKSQISASPVDKIAKKSSLKECVFVN